MAVVGSCLIMFVVLYLTHGLSARTSTAVLGTLLSLALIGVLGAAFSAAARLTGLDDQTSNLIATLGTGVDARGLLLAGVIIGALGVLDDVTVTQTSAVWELRRANPQLGAGALFTAAMRIGRDHVASAVNTLVLAYAGASLPLLLLFTLSGRALGEVVTAQDVATEVVRTLVGSIGLVASVPITTALAALVASREPTGPRVEPHERRGHQPASPSPSRSGQRPPGRRTPPRSSPGAARHGPGSSPTSDSTVTTSSPPGPEPLDQPRVQPRDRGTAGRRPRRRVRRSRRAARRRGRAASHRTRSADPGGRGQRRAAASATPDTSTASTTNPRAASHTATAPRPQATSRARPPAGSSCSRPRSASGGSGRTSVTAACRASQRARSSPVTRGPAAVSPARRPGGRAPRPADRPLLPRRHVLDPDVPASRSRSPSTSAYRAPDRSAAFIAPFSPRPP